MHTILKQIDQELYACVLRFIRCPKSDEIPVLNLITIASMFSEVKYPCPIFMVLEAGT